MIKKKLLLLFLMVGLLVSCEKEEYQSRIYSFTGKAQKGPFITGTTVTLNELNQSLGQTGKSFTTTISSDEGTFSLNNIELNSNLALLTANGFYFSEIYGELSAAPLSLQAISDLTNKESVNINVFTHLIKGRIENLIAGGLSYSDARKQATSELISFLGITETIDLDFESLDISGSEEANGLLLAFSVILQRYTMISNDKPTLTAELTQLLAGLSADFVPDGQITDKTIIDKLLYNISQLNLTDIRKNVQKRYADLGKIITVPDFEKYISKFQIKYANNITTTFSYPEMATPEPVMSPNSKIPNILDPAAFVFNMNTPYCAAAIVPLNKSLTIKVKNITGSCGSGGPLNGWEYIYDHNTPDLVILNSQRQNTLVTMLFIFNTPGSATVEYYEDNKQTPVYTKKISWQ